ncbi:MAG: DUF2793 domain-containing protein [Proteobacteria bacterium]|nr:DUF2793 domain-containing protein [Pseudomonadota bacterium]
MEQNTPRFSMNYIYPNQSQKEVLLNEALARIDALLLPSAVSRTLKQPPPEAGKHKGELYIIPEAAQNSWSWPEGTHYIVLSIGGDWVWIPPKKGMLIWVCDEMRPCVYDGMKWRALSVSYADGFLGL